jgi:hypothetical protein
MIALDKRGAINYYKSMKNTRCDECGRQLGGPNGGHRIGCNFDTSCRPEEQVASAEQERRKRLASYAVVYTTPLQTQEAEHTKILEFSKTGVNQYTGTTVEQFARKNVADCTGGYGFLVSVTKIADLVPEAR